MNTANEKYRLGLDMGTNSIGWAAVRLDDDGDPCGLLDMGVRIFSDGRNPKDGSSNAVKRRLPRGQRRRRDRYLKRRDSLMGALLECGLMPDDKRERKKLEACDPYALRERALDEPLSPYELGRALFHLSHRRGFKSNRKAGNEDESEAKKTRAEIDALRAQIDGSGARTLGEFMAKRHSKGEPVRARRGQNLYPDRAMYEREFDAIREQQKPHQGLSAEQWEWLRSIILFQRPLRPVDPGYCQLETGERRAPKALPIAQEFRMLQEVNNLKIRVGTEPERRLDAKERERALTRLRAGKDIKLREGKDNRPAKLTRDLDLPSGAVFNLARGGRKSVEGDKTAARLMSKKEKGEKEQELFGDRWHEFSPAERNDIAKSMLKTEDPEVVQRKAMDEWGLDEAQAKAISHVSLPRGYGNLSEKAITKLLPHLEKGLVYSDAVLAAGYPHHSDFRNAEAHGKLPYYGEVLERDAVGADPTKDPEKDGEPARYGRIGNPTVHIGLGQLRRVVNGLIESYGKPEEIVVELARDLKMNREQKQNYQRQQREGGERNQRFREDLKSAELSVTPEALRKLRLWEEQGPCQARLCPYTGRPLSFEMVVSSQTEIDHILPFSRTWDDSPANKVVCVREANRYKGDRSPYEAFGKSSDGYDYDKILTYAAKLPDNKRWRFEPDAMKRFEEEGRFLDRQLNETRYLSRTARTYLAHLYDEKTEGSVRVRVVPGHMTAVLRRGWGLENMLRVDQDGVLIKSEKKQRDDHRHHAIDAFVVANTTQGLLQRFARAAGSNDDTEERLAAVAGSVVPWKGFDREDLRPFLNRMVVSHKPDHGTRGVDGKTTGQLHNATAYGLIEYSEDGPSKVVVRKKLTDFKRRADLESIRDSALRQELLALWDRVKSEGGKPADFAERAADGAVLGGHPVRSARVVENLRVIAIKDSNGNPYKGYKLDNNEFADVWAMRDGNWKIRVVSTFEANQRDFDIEDSRPVTSRGKHKGKPDPAAKWLMRLYKGDMGALEDGAGVRIVKVRKFSSGSVILDDHNEANVDGRERKGEIDRNMSIYSAKQLREQGFRKVRVTEIGRVRDLGPL